MSIRVYNRFLDMLFEIDRYQSLQFKRSYHGVGDFELHINRYINGADTLEKGNLIALNKDENKVGIILTKEIALDEKGKATENFKLTGYSLDGIMNRRVVVPPMDTSHDRKSGSAEAVMKHYVERNFVNPDDAGRKLDILEIAPNQNRGEYISWESRWKTPVDTELEKISISTGLGWVVYADFKTKKIIFDVIERKDLAQDNEQGNNPVFFSPEFETIKSQSFINSDQDYKNVAYIGGQGEGVDRKIVTIGEATGWDRIETFIDARDISDEDEETGEELTDEEVEQLLIERGEKKMADMETIFTLEAEILTPTRDSVYEYGKDFDLGDIVDVVNKSWNITMTAPITELLEIYEPGGFRLQATFGRNRPTLTGKLEDRFNELEGIEKQEAPEQVSVRRMNEAKEYAKEQDEYVREDAKDFADIAEENSNKYTNKVDTENREFTNYLMEKANREIEDTKKRLEQAQKDLGVADESIKKALEDIGNLKEEIENLPDGSHEELEELRKKVKEAQDLIDSVTEDKDGQTVLKGTLLTNEIIAEDATLTGSLKGSNATIDDLTTNNMTAINAIIQDAIVKGEFGANEATMLGLTTQEMTAINAIIQDAKITGNLNASDAIFQKGRFNEVTIVDAIIENVRGLTGTFSKVTAENENFFLKDVNSGLESIAIFKNNLLKDHSFENVGTGKLVSGGNMFEAVSRVPNEVSGWVIHEGTPRIVDNYYNTYGLQSDDESAIFGLKSAVVGGKDYFAQMVPADAQEQYTVSIHAKRYRTWGAGNLEIVVEHVEVVDGLPNVVKTDRKSFGNVTEEAVRYAYTITVHPNAKLIRVMYKAKETGWAMVDGAQLVEGKYPSQYNPEEELSFFMQGFLRAHRLYASEFEAETIAFQHHSGAQFDQYGNIHAPASAVDNANWGIIDKNGKVIFRAYWGDDPNNYGVQIQNSNFRVRDGRLINQATYDTTTGGNANMYVATNGFFARSSSARKYKEYIQLAGVDYTRLLDIEPKSWYDKGELKNNGGSTEGLRRYYGAVANDFEKVGLPEYVVYDDRNGEIENFNDRAWILLIPNINDMKKEIKELYEMKEEMRQLKEEVSQLRQEVKEMKE